MVPDPEVEMQVRDRMTRHPLTILPDATLREAVVIMSEHGVRGLPVVDGDEVVGIITDRDVKMALGPDARSMDVAQIDPRQLEGSVAWFMTEGVVTVTEDAPLAQVARELAALKVGALPVVDKRGELSGILSATDLVLLAAELLEG